MSPNRAVEILQPGICIVPQFTLSQPSPLLGLCGRCQRCVPAVGVFHNHIELYHPVLISTDGHKPLSTAHNINALLEDKYFCKP